LDGSQEPFWNLQQARVEVGKVGDHARLAGSKENRGAELAIEQRHRSPAHVPVAVLGAARIEIAQRVDRPRPVLAQECPYGTDVSHHAEYAS
jgi:hypothetical protein